jgi:hypothetical protein
VYESSGLLPNTVYRLRDKTNGQCLQLNWVKNGAEGTLTYADCGESDADPRQIWHGANRRSSVEKGNGSCCSGLRGWNSDQCVSQRDNGISGAVTYVCSTFGEFSDQWIVLDGGKLQFQGSGALPLNKCVGLSAGEEVKVRVLPCSESGSVWEKISQFEPLETTLYRKYLGQAVVV